MRLVLRYCGLRVMEFADVAELRNRARHAWIIQIIQQHSIHQRHPHVNPLFRAWAATPTYEQTHHVRKIRP